MPVDPQILLCARAVQVAYQMGDMSVAAGTITGALDALGLTIEAVIDGVDPTRGPTLFGFIASAPDGSTYCAIRGTTNAIEGFEDAEFAQSACPLVPGANWEDGFGQVFNSLTVAGQSLPDFLGESPLVDPANMIFTGHSLGAPLALFAALSHGAKAVHLFESPRPGNAALAAAVQASSWFPASTAWAVDEDWVPDWPKGLWPLVPDYKPGIPPRILSSRSVTPALGAGLLLPIEREEAMHALANVIRLLSALP